MLNGTYVILCFCTMCLFAPTRRDKLQHLQVNIPMVTIEHCTWEYSARDLFLFGEGTLSPSFMAVPIYMHTHTPKDMCVYIYIYMHI